MRNGPEAVTCGEAMLLMLAEPGLPLERATHFRRSVAGAESNVAAGLARLGHWARWIGRVGDDPAGEAVLRELRADGVDVSCAEMDPESPTGLLLRDSHPRRAVDVQYYRTGSAASLLSPAQITPEALAGVRLVHVTGITPMLSEDAEKATHALIEGARGRPVPPSASTPTCGASWAPTTSGSGAWGRCCARPISSSPGRRRSNSCWAPGRTRVPKPC